MSRLTLLCACFLSVVPCSAQRPEFELSRSDRPVKVFILAGQSNMEGKGFPRPLTWQLTQEKYRDRYVHLIRDGDFDAFNALVKSTTDPDDPKKRPQYSWSVRRDVWINYLRKRGDLSVGYGSPQDGFGPELNFGHVVGNHFDEQVLLIKTAWGGRALARGFLSPSSMPDDAEFTRQTKELNAKNRAWNEAEPARIEAHNKRAIEFNKTAEKKRRLRTFRPRGIVTVEQYKRAYGADYRNMVSEVHTCLKEIGKRFPDYRDQGFEIAGFVWFQGWNDQYEQRWLSYEKNMANFIRDVRREFRTPGLPFVIGQMGHDGTRPLKEDSPRFIIKKAQAAVAEYPEFRGTVACVKTDRYWDMDADAIFRGEGGWKKDVNKWRQFGDDGGYHYYGSPWFFSQAGSGFGKAMIRLLDK